jgi:hypothetical protein
MHSNCKIIQHSLNSLLIITYHAFLLVVVFWPYQGLSNLVDVDATKVFMLNFCISHLQTVQKFCDTLDSTIVCPLRTTFWDQYSLETRSMLGAYANKTGTKEKFQNRARMLNHSFCQGLAQPKASKEL